MCSSPSLTSCQRRTVMSLEFFLKWLQHPALRQTHVSLVPLMSLFTRLFSIIQTLQRMSTSCHTVKVFYFCCFYQEIKTRLFLSAPSCLIPLTILAHSFFCVVLRQRSLHHWPSRPQTHIQHITAERTVHSSPAQCVGGCV